MLPIRPFTLKKAASVWGISEGEAEKMLDGLCEKGLMVDSYNKGVRQFVLPPPMIGFFEFALMRTRGDIDQKYLSELFYQYIDVEEDFIKSLFFDLDTKLARVFVQEPVLLTEKANHILDYEQFAEPLLFNVRQNEPAYYEAKRLLKFLEYFVGVDTAAVPTNSLLREFVGGGCFDA